MTRSTSHCKAFHCVTCLAVSFMISLDIVIVATGQHCFAVAASAFDIVTTQKNVEKAASQLSALHDDAKHLQKVAEEIRENFANKEKELQKELTVLDAEMQSHQSAVTMLNDEKSQAEARRRMQEQRITDTQNELREAEGRLSTASTAERDLHRAKTVMTTSIATSAVVGIVTFGVGALVAAGVGAAAEAGIGALINDAEGRVREARSDIGHKKDDIERTKKELSDTNSSLNSVQQQISSFQARIAGKKNEIDRVHRKIGGIKESIAFQLKSIHFWQLFTQASETATERNQRLEKIVSKAAEKENLKIMRSNGTTIIAKSFLEAWKEISNNGCIM